jgi:hypothetical protein
MNLNWKQLITDPDGTLSHTKVWSNIANSVGAGAFIMHVAKYPLTPELLGTFILAIGAQRVASKYLDKDKTIDISNTNEGEK